MKTILRIYFLYLLFFISPYGGIERGFTQSGGPDVYGYTWRDTSDSLGPTYSWIELRTKGLKIGGLGDDNIVGPYSIGFNFHYYWNDYSELWIGSNGYIAFQGGGNLASPFLAIPTIGGSYDNFVAGMLCDLYPLDATGAKVYTWNNGSDTFIVQFDSVPFWAQFAPGFSGRNTFQIILAGSDSSITFQYKLQTGLTYANSLKSGIENITGAIGLQVLNDIYPTGGTAVKFYYPDSVTYQVFDVMPSWNHNSGNGGIFISVGGTPLILQSMISNVGNQDIDTSFPVIARMLDSNMAIVFTDTVTIDSLPAGADTLVTFPIPFIPSTANDYIFRTITMYSSDMNSNNNIRYVEVVAVDTSIVPTELKFDRGYLTNNISWLGGGGAGMYFIPPNYPVSVVAAEYFMVANSSSAGFIATIRDDNGTGGSPGTLLYSDTFPGGIFVPNQFTLLGLQPITLTSGGVYIGWESYDDSIGIGVDNTIPPSYRSYEILGGGWAIYRNQVAEDFMIRMMIEPATITPVEPMKAALANISLFPNPAAGKVFASFQVPVAGKGELEVSGMSGKIIKKIPAVFPVAARYLYAINLENDIAPGVYLITLKMAGNIEIVKSGKLFLTGK